MNIVDLVDDKLERHHLIPLGSSTQIFESTKSIRRDNNHILNSVLNYSLISRQENNRISAMAINEYITIPNFPLMDYYLAAPIFQNDNWKDRSRIYEALSNRLRVFKDALHGHLINLRN